MRVRALLIAIVLATNVHHVRAETVVEQDRAAFIRELVHFVRTEGWRANLGNVCPSLGVSAEADCVFTQISVTDNHSVLNSHGFNVRASLNTEDEKIIVFHLTPEIGRFLLIDSVGDIKASVYRKPGTDYVRSPIQDAREAYENALAFWKRNLAALREMSSRSRGRVP